MGGAVERLSDKERERLGVLLAEGAPAWRVHRESVAVGDPAGDQRVAAAT